MLSKSDYSLTKAEKFISESGFDHAFIVPTENGLNKAILDAHDSLRFFLEKSGLHFFDKQEKGSDNKIVLDCYFAHLNSFEKTSISLYRPETKLGDPRLWIYDLKKYSEPNNLIAIVYINKIIFIINVSKVNLNTVISRAKDFLSGSTSEVKHTVKVNDMNFPRDLLNWAGHRAGGVKKMFYASSGRPSGGIIYTELLYKIDKWASDLSNNLRNAPRIILLIGGPGNGKTEAVEFALSSLDRHFQFAGKLLEEVSKLYVGLGDQPSPRLVKFDVLNSSGGTELSLEIVQDASATDKNYPNLTAAELLINDLESAKEFPENKIYIACINRGILDDAQIVSIDKKKIYSQEILESITGAASLMPDSPECWPLSGFSNFGIWPMDVESLVASHASVINSPLDQILDIALNDSSWKEYESCGAGAKCPFCLSKKRLSNSEYRQSLVKYFRWYEIASGKRWSFRDIFSLLAFLLAGVSEITGEDGDPCEIAKNLVASIDNPLANKNKSGSSLFNLVAMQYHQALFIRCNQYNLKQLKLDIQDIKMNDTSAHLILNGFLNFVSNSFKERIPTTLDLQLARIGEVLDPAIADSDYLVNLSSKTRVPLREIDARFSQSVGEGLRYLQPYQCLSVIEVELLKRIASLDQKISGQEFTSKRSTSADRVLRHIREFACSIARRSIGSRACVARDSNILDDFEKVIDGNVELLYLASKEFDRLINTGRHGDKFEVQLNSTFGEPMPQAERRAVLITAKQKVKPADSSIKNGPRTPIQFLRVGSLGDENLIPLTFDLFKSIYELRKGMMPSSLPRSVVALLDTTKAKLAGSIVRNDEQLDGSEIQIGINGDIVVRELGQFIVRRRGDIA